MANGPEFTDRDIELIIKSLPGGVDKRRLELLPKILREWAGTDLPLHLSILPIKTKKKRSTRLSSVDGCARRLSQALDAIDRNDERFWIIKEIIVADGQRLSQTKRVKLEDQFQEMKDFLGKLATASAASAKIWKQGRGQPRNVAASFVLMDIVAIYEWLTDKKATRRADRYTFKDSGPFWVFAGAIWPAVFGNGNYGLSAAIKNWDDARKKKLKGTHSPLLANIAMRHPEWGLFEP
jgi:hypothetical protein